MNDDTPPPLTPSSPVTGPTGDGGGNDGRNGKKIALGCSLGCLVSLVVTVVVGYFVFIGIKNKAADAVASYTSSQPVEIVEPATPEAEVTDAIVRFDKFRAALSAGEATEPLLLSESDINALLFHHSLFKKAAGKGIVSIEDNKLKSKVSIDFDELNIPFEFLAETVKGRHFNGVATVSIGMKGGRPELYIEDLVYNGAPVPQVLTDMIRQEDPMKTLEENPAVKVFIEGVEDIRIEYNQLKITPKASN